MSTLFTINACRTFGCRSLGLAPSEDYSWPDYKSGYPALHCRACSNYPPLFDEQQFRDRLSVRLSTYTIEKGHPRPVYYGTDVICYSHNPQGPQRIQCRNCKEARTPKKYQKETTHPQAIEAVQLLILFQGTSAVQKLYVLASLDITHSNILHLSTNYIQHQAGDSLRYSYKGSTEPTMHHRDIAQKVDMHEAWLLCRGRFNEIQYGSAAFKRNGKGVTLRPVITTRGHFRILKIRYPDVRTHTISHEYFLRGAIITAWADQFRQQQGELWFVEEEVSDSNADMPWHFKGATYRGWWQNQRQHWE